MPLCELYTNVSLSTKDKNDTALIVSATVAEMLGKPESYVMVRIATEETMTFGGSDEPLCFIRLGSLGLPEDQTKPFSDTLSSLCNERLGVPPGRTYIEFHSPPRHMWGYNGSTFG